MPAYIHSDRGSAFMSDEFERNLFDKGIASCCTTGYNPAINGQVGLLNQTLWQTIKLQVKTHKIATSTLERVVKRCFTFC